MTYYRTELDGQTHSFKDLGFRTVDFVVSSPSFSYDEKMVNSVTGIVATETTRQPRQISVTFSVMADDWIDFAMLRQKIFDVVSNNPIYLIEERKPGEMWECRVKDPYVLRQLNTYSVFTIDFICFAGASMSIGTTAEDDTFDALSYYNLPTTIDDYKDIKKVAFRIFNPGLAIDPRNRNTFFKIVYKGESSRFGITNLTTGDVFEYEGSTGENDTLTIDGINSFKNNTSIFLDTNKQLISLAHGWNEFVLHGVPGATELTDFEEIDGENPISFIFRFNFN